MAIYSVPIHLALMIRMHDPDAILVTIAESNDHELMLFGARKADYSFLKSNDDTDVNKLLSIIEAEKIKAFDFSALYRDHYERGYGHDD